MVIDICDSRTYLAAPGRGTGTKAAVGRPGRRHRGGIMATALMTSAELQRSDAVVPEWVRAAHRQYREVILDPRFPCYFGTKAEAQGHMRFAYVRHDRDPVLPRAL